MILIAYLITHSKTWKNKDASIRLYKIVRKKKEYDLYKNKLNKIVNTSRIDNVSITVIYEPKKNVERIIRETSKYADLVLMGLPHFKSKGISSDIHKEIENYTKGLSTTLFVLANDKIDFKIN